jgi:hypothetical protein
MPLDDEVEQALGEQPLTERARVLAIHEEAAVVVTAP